MVISGSTQWLPFVFTTFPKCMASAILPLFDPADVACKQNLACRYIYLPFHDTNVEFRVIVIREQTPLFRETKTKGHRLTTNEFMQIITKRRLCPIHVSLYVCTDQSFNHLPKRDNE